MPKKTREQKMHAALRRTSFQNLPSQPLPERVSKQALPEEKEVTSIYPTSEDDRIIRFFQTDLKRSLFFIALIIGLEISLYFASINHYFGLGR